MKAVFALSLMFWSTRAWAQQAPAMPRADLGSATGWLAAAAVAMVLALWAVHWSIFRRK